MNVTTKYVETKPTIESFTLTLSMDEAQYIVALLGPTLGMMGWELYKTLNAAGVPVLTENKYEVEPATSLCGVVAIAVVEKRR